MLKKNCFEGTCNEATGQATQTLSDNLCFQMSFGFLKYNIDYFLTQEGEEVEKFTEKLKYGISVEVLKRSTNIFENVVHAALSVGSDIWMAKRNMGVLRDREGSTETTM